jgi:hypothetical protein
MAYQLGSTPARLTSVDGRIGRIIDDHDLQTVPYGLALERLEGGAEPVGTVVAADDHGQIGRAGHAGTNDV